MNFEMIAIVVLVGLLAGWLAGLVMKGGGYGLGGDIALGIAGGVAGGLVLKMVAVPPAGTPLAIVSAALFGAVVVILVQRAVWPVSATGTR